MMKKELLTIAAFLTCTIGFSQESKKSSKDDFLKEVSENGCKCVDSIVEYNKSKDVIAKEIGSCIDKQTVAYQLGSKIMGIEELKEKAPEKDGKKQINIDIATNENSKEYKKYFFEIERYMMDNCPSVKAKIAVNETQNQNSISKNEKALEFYMQGLKEVKAENFAKAAECFEKAVKEDSQFAFAWDNLGINYRRLNNFDKAIYAYEQSLKIDPNGLMPLQNIAIVYQYKKQYHKAIDAYKRLAKVDSNNPEVFYGIGNVYAVNLKDYENGLDNVCKAYNIYVEQKSPYRTDAEKLVSYIYGEMKKEGKEAKFHEILKANNISSGK